MEKSLFLGGGAVCRQGQTSTSGRADATRMPSCTPHSRSPRGQALVRNDARGGVTLLDYGAGNVRSVRNAIKKLGYNLKEVKFLTGTLFSTPCCLTWLTR